MTNSSYQDYLERKNSLIKETNTYKRFFSSDHYEMEVEEQYYFEGDDKTFKLYTIYINGYYSKSYLRLPKQLKEFFNYQ